MRPVTGSRDFLSRMYLITTRRWYARGFQQKKVSHGKPWFDVMQSQVSFLIPFNHLITNVKTSNRKSESIVVNIV